MTNGKVGSLLWIENVLDAVNKGVAKVKDRVTNLDLIWWLEKHFEIKIEVQILRYLKKDLIIKYYLIIFN